LILSLKNKIKILKKIKKQKKKKTKKNKKKIEYLLIFLFYNKNLYNFNILWYILIYINFYKISILYTSKK